MQIARFRYLGAGPNGAGIWGRGGAAITTDGRVIVETGDGAFDPEKGQMADSVIALSSKDLKVSDYFTPRNRSWMTKKDLDMSRLAIRNIRLKAAQRP